MSDKLNIIDCSTFEKHQQLEESKKIQVGKNKIIRNAKYKKTSKAGYNLFDFLTHRHKQSSARIKRKTERLQHTTDRPKSLLYEKRSGKKREVRKKLRRLKKAILRCRQQRHAEQQRLQDPKPEDHNSNLDEMHRSNVDEPIPFSVHSRRFRDYCDNCTTPLLCSLTQSLLADLNRFQRRAYAQNEIKARGHRRFVLGFREVQSLMQIGKIQLLIIAPDLEISAGEAGLDTIIATLKAQCHIKQIPYVFSLRRRQIAYSLHKKAAISCVGVLDYSGVRETVAQLLAELERAREAYQELQQQKQQSQKEQSPQELHSEMSALFEKNCAV